MSIFPLIGVMWLLILLVVLSWCRAGGRADRVIEGWRNEPKP